MRVPFLVAAIFMIATANASQKNQENAAIREIRLKVDEVLHEIKNHESEIRGFEEKLANQDLIIESLREQNLNLSKTNQDATKNTIANLEMKIGGLDTAIKGLNADIRQLKTHANETSSLYAEKVNEVEKMVGVHSSNLKQLQSAISSLMAILEVKQDPQSSETSGEFREHRVQSGDSLAKIAKLYRTSVKRIKEINDLKTDRIVIGQNIKIP